MKKLIIAIGLIGSFIGSQANAADQRPNEWTTIPDGANYTIKGAGINYEVSPGVFVEADPTITGNPTTWECNTVVAPWSIQKSNQRITITRGGVSSSIRPDGIYWFRPSDYDFTEAVPVQVPSIAEESTKITLTGVAAGVNGEIVSQYEGVDWDYIVNDMTGWTPNPYDPASSYLVVRYLLESVGHTMTAGGQAVNWSGTQTEELKFSGGGKHFDIATTEATDSTGLQSGITYFLHRAQGKDYMSEGVPASWIASASLPVRYHYETKSGGLSDNDTWTAGTYMITSTISTGSYTLTWEPGVVAKVANGTNGIYVSFNGGSWVAPCTQANPCYLVSCFDDTYGEPVQPTYCTPADPTTNGYWSNTAQNSLDIEWVVFRGVSEDMLRIAPVTLSSTKTFSVDHCLFDNQGAGFNFHHIEMFPTNSNFDNANISITNNIFMNGQDGAAHGYAVYYDSSMTNNNATLLVHNNFCRKFGYGNRGCYYFDNNNIANDFGDVTITNNTAYNDTNTGSHMYIIEAHSGWTVTDNSIRGGFNGFLQSADRTFTHTNNNAYGATNNYTYWTQDATETELDPGYTTHSGGISWPDTWFDDAGIVHISSGNTSLQNKGSRTAAAAGLDTYHTLDDGTVDSGDVDIGFHYPVVAAAPPGPGGGGGSFGGGWNFAPFSDTGRANWGATGHWQ